MARKCKCSPCVGELELDASSPDCDTADLEAGDRYTQNNILFEVNGGSGVTVTNVVWTLITGAATVTSDTGQALTVSVGGTVDFGEPEAIAWDANPIEATASITYICDATGRTHYAVVPHSVHPCSGGNEPLTVDTADGDCCLDCDLSAIVRALIPEAPPVAEPEPATPVTLITEECLAPLGAVTVEGAAVTSTFNAQATRTGVGQWNLTPPTGAMYANVSVIEDRATRDDIVAHLNNPLGTQVTISEQDNGGAAGVVRDNGFTIVWYGTKSVVVGSTTGGNGDGGGEVLTPAGRGLVSDNCQDGGGNAPFNLQIRNTTNTPTNWVMIWTGRPYATIPALVLPNGVQYDGATPDGGGGFDHRFSSTTPLGAFQNATIAGAVPTPAGNNDCATVERFIV